MDAPWVVDLVAIVMPLVIGYLTVPITDAIKHATTWMDTQPAAIKQGLAAAVASALTLGARLLETQLPTELALWDATTVDAVVSAVFAMALKHGQHVTQVKRMTEEFRAETT